MKVLNKVHEKGTRQRRVGAVSAKANDRESFITERERGNEKSTQGPRSTSTKNPQVCCTCALKRFPPSSHMVATNGYIPIPRRFTKNWAIWQTKCLGNTLF